MTWEHLKEIAVGLGAPILGTALAGPEGGLIGEALAVKFNVPATPEAVKGAITANLSGSRSILQEFETENADLLKVKATAEVKVVQAVAAEETAEAPVQSSQPMTRARAFMVYCCGAGFIYGVLVAPILSGIFSRAFPSPGIPEIIAMLGLLLGHGAEHVIKYVSDNMGS